MTAAPAEGACINLIEIKFIDDTLYFIRKSKPVRQVNIIQIFNQKRNYEVNYELSPNSILILMTLHSKNKTEPLEINHRIAKVPVPCPTTYNLHI